MMIATGECLPLLEEVVNMGNCGHNSDCFV